MHYADLQPLWKEGQQEDGQIKGVLQQAEHRGHDLTLSSTGHALNRGEEHDQSLRMTSTDGDF